MTSKDKKFARRAKRKAMRQNLPNFVQSELDEESELIAEVFPTDIDDSVWEQDYYRKLDNELLQWYYENDSMSQYEVEYWQWVGSIGDDL